MKNKSLPSFVLASLREASPVHSSVGPFVTLSTRRAKWNESHENDRKTHRWLDSAFFVRILSSIYFNYRDGKSRSSRNENRHYARGNPKNCHHNEVSRPIGPIEPIGCVIGISVKGNVCIFAEYQRTDR